MHHVYDIYGNIQQNRIYLANPQKNYLGEIYNAKEIKLVDSFINLNELSFVVHEYENGELQELFDEIENKRLVEFQYMGWYQVNEVQVLQEEDSVYRKKSVKCLSLENELVDKRLDYIEGVYSLYDVLDTEYSLLHIIASRTNWKIGHVDNELIGKKRTFDIDSTKIYNFLTKDVSKSFECIFIFDTYSRTINAYKLSAYGTLTNIIVSGENILKSYEQVSKGEEIITKMRVQGASGVDIRDVNPTASNDLINIDYFLNTKWMSQSLIDAYKQYQVAYQNVLTSYNTKRTLLKNQLAELAILKAQLNDLEGLKKAQEEIQGAYIQLYNGTPPRGTNEYTLYLNATNNIASYVGQIALKKSDIKAKEIQINATKITLEDIGTNLSMSNYLTSAQLDELELFFIEGETYQDETFVVTDNMSDSEILEMKMELMQNGANELFRASQPQFTTTISANNLFTMMDESDSAISYSEWVTQFEVGNLITVKFRDDYFVTARLVKKEPDFENRTDLQLTFSNKDRFEDELILLQDLIADAGKTASTISLNKYGYDQASSITSEVRDFMNGTFDATLNKMRSSENEEFIITPYGAMMKRWLPDQNKYSDYQSWWTGNTLLFSSDGFKTAQTGIGLFTETNGSTFYGVLGSVIVGELFIGEKLKLTGSGASLDLSANNAITGLSAQITADINGLSASFTNKINETNSLFAQTADQITQSVTDVKNNLQGQIDVQAGKIDLKVDNNGIINAINLSNEGVKINASKLAITGVVTISDLQDNTLTINGGRLYIPVGGAIFLSQDMGNTSYGTALAINGTWDISLGNTNRSNTSIYAKNYIDLQCSSNSIGSYGVILPANTYMRKSINNSGYGNAGSVVAIMKDLEGFVNTSDLPSIMTKIYSESSSSTSYYLTLNSSRALVPNYSSSYSFHLGSSSYPFTDLYIKNINHLSGTIGFFGKSPISKITVSAMTTSADLNTVHSKLNELIKALNSSGYGLV